MQKSDNFVSIILPVRNAEKFLEESLPSLLNQTYTSFEVIAIDDNSSDNSYKILRKYRRLDKRLLISQNVKKYGLSITLNRALKKARGQYIAFMNPKDTCSVERIKKQILYLKRHPKVVAVGTQSVFTNENRKRLEKSEFPTEHTEISKTLLMGTAMQLESVMINRYLLPKDLLRFEHQKFPLLFRSLFMKMMPYGNFANINEYLYMRYRHDNHFEELRLKFTSHVALWLKAWFTNDDRPSLQSLLYPLNNRVKSI